MTPGASGPASIGVVAYEMEGAPTGVGRYLEELLTALRCTPRARGWRLQLFFKGDPFEHPLWTGGEAGGCTCEAVFDRRGDAHPVFWEQFRLPRVLRRRPVDVLFSPGYSLPRAAARPSLVTIHDLSFELLPRDFAFRERWRRRLLARRAARSATRVLTDTDRTATELQKRYGVPEERIAVAPLGVSARFEPVRESVSHGDAGRSEPLPGLGVRRPYLLVLGSILARRRLDLVLAGLHRLLSGSAKDPSAGTAEPFAEDLQLVIAGSNQLPRRDDLGRMIRSSGCADRVVQLGYVEDGVLPDLYAGAVGTIYVSEYEGYGLPPLESLAAGVPALVADAPALLELWPDYPLRCDRLDVDAVTDGLQRLLFDAAAREFVASEGPMRVRSLTWARAAERFAIEVETAWRTAQQQGS